MFKPWLLSRILACLLAACPAAFGEFIVQYFEDSSLVQITGNCQFDSVSTSLSYECAAALPIPKADPAKGPLQAVHFSILGTMQQTFLLDTVGGAPPPPEVDVSLTSLFQYQFPSHSGLLAGGQNDGVLRWPEEPSISEKAGILKSLVLTDSLAPLYGSGSYLFYLNLASLGLAEPDFPVYSNYFVGDLFTEIRYEYGKSDPGGPVPEPPVWILNMFGSVPLLALAARRYFRRRMLF